MNKQGGLRATTAKFVVIINNLKLKIGVLGESSSWGDDKSLIPHSFIIHFNITEWMNRLKVLTFATLRIITIS